MLPCGSFLLGTKVGPISRPWVLRRCRIIRTFGGNLGGDTPRALSFSSGGLRGVGCAVVLFERGLEPPAQLSDRRERLSASGAFDEGIRMRPWRDIHRHRAAIGAGEFRGRRSQGSSEGTGGRRAEDRRPSAQVQAFNRSDAGLEQGGRGSRASRRSSFGGDQPMPSCLDPASACRSRCTLRASVPAETGSRISVTACSAKSPCSSRCFQLGRANQDHSLGQYVSDAKIVVAWHLLIEITRIFLRHPCLCGDFPLQSCTPRIMRYRKRPFHRKRSRSATPWLL